MGTIAVSNLYSPGQKHSKVSIKTKTIASITASAEAIAAVTGKVIKVIGYELSAAGTVNVKFQSENTTDECTGSTLTQLIAGGFTLRPIQWIGGKPLVYFQTGLGKNLYINLSASQSVTATIWYYEE